MIAGQTRVLVRSIDAAGDPAEKARLLGELVAENPALADRLYAEDWDEEDEDFEPEWYPLPDDLRAAGEEEPEQYAAGMPCKPGETAENTDCAPAKGGLPEPEAREATKGFVASLRAGMRGIKDRVKAIERRMATSLEREGYSSRAAKAIMLASAGAKVGGGPVQIAALALGGPAAYAVVAGSVVGPLADAAIVFLGAKYGRRAVEAASRLLARRKKEVA